MQHLKQSECEDNNYNWTLGCTNPDFDDSGCTRRKDKCMEDNCQVPMHTWSESCSNNSLLTESECTDDLYKWGYCNNATFETQSKCEENNYDWTLGCTNPDFDDSNCIRQKIYAWSRGVNSYLHCIGIVELVATALFLTESECTSVSYKWGYCNNATFETQSECEENNYNWTLGCTNPDFDDVYCTRQKDICMEQACQVPVYSWSWSCSNSSLLTELECTDDLYKWGYYCNNATFETQSECEDNNYNWTLGCESRFR